MAIRTTGKVALFSIHPSYADGILDGTKQVEFRRTRLSPEVSHIVIYATAPVMRVVGIVEVEGVEEMPTSNAWRDFGERGGITREALRNYYRGSRKAYVIKVCNPKRLQRPVALTDLREDLRPPQSFQYLCSTILDALVPQSSLVA